MADVFWDRLEPHSREEDLEEGLQARVADPLWMLARQWQVGEFRGEDAATPIHARVEVVSMALRSFRNETVAGADSRKLGRAAPLEARVEAESVWDGPAASRLAAEAGHQLLVRLDAIGLGHLRDDLRREFPLAVDEDELAALPAGERVRLRLLARRSIDGNELRRATWAELRAVGLTAAERAAVRPVFEVWRAETNERFVEPGEAGDAWEDERLEYAFSLGGKARGEERVVAAREYPGGRLDWYGFDLQADGSHGLGGAPGAGTRAVVQALPVPLAYAGMPASRWWELEDGRVYFGGLATGPADLGRLAVAEYATIYSDDWFLVPLRVPVQALSRIRSMRMLDTFGRDHPVDAAAALDETQGGGTVKPRPWGFFELAGDEGPVDGRAPWLCVPPVLATSLHGEPVERVSFVRDEASNVGWAIEELVETPNGKGMKRRLRTGLLQADVSEVSEASDEGEGAAPTETAGGGEGEPWRWRVQTDVPPHWIPLVPQRVSATSAQVRLHRGRLLAWEALDPRVAGARGRVLAPDRPLRLHEEEVPKGGVQVTRRWQVARGVDGRLYVWMARQKRPGRGDRGAGLRFDALDRSP